MPRSPSPTVRSPMTAPALNAMGNALLRLFVAPCAVLTFALTAMSIPMYPASPLQIAPMMYAVARMPPWKNGCGRKMNSSIDMAAANMASVLYCLMRYAFAPSLMAAAISFIFSVPGSWFLTCLYRISATMTDAIPDMGARISHSSAISCRRWAGCFPS